MAQKIRRSTVLLVTLIGAAALVVSAVGGYWAWRTWIRPSVGGTTIPVTVVDSSGQTGGEVSMGESGSTGGITVLLSEGQSQPQQVIQVPVADGEPLTEEQIQAILDRLPGFEGETGDQTDFRLAQDPIPPPLTGDTLDEPFPPPEQPVGPEAVETGPLEVLRYAPEGEIPIAPFVNINYHGQVGFPGIPIGA